MNNRKFKILEIIGIPVIFLLATLLHFVYDFTDGSTLSILFGAVNESVWEHVKIFAVGYVFWSLVELLWVKPPFKKFVTAKTIALYFLSLAIIVFFYTYNLFSKEPILWLDISSSFVFVVLSQYISYRLITNENDIKDYFTVALMMLMLFFLMFFSFTAFPPKIDLFRDPITGMYGIIEDYIDKGAVFLHKS